LHPGACFLASSIFILLWVIDEVSFDRFHKDNDRIFQGYEQSLIFSRTATYENKPGPLSAALKELPEVEESCLLTTLLQILRQGFISLT
jgi:putative ABC transport system permease protein